jgi:signal transduction histidine kinase
LVVFGGLVYVLVSASLTRQVEETLQRTADDILEASKFQIAGIPLLQAQLDYELTANTFVKILDDEGKLIRQTFNSPSSDFPFDETVIETQGPIFSTVTIEDTRLRILTVPVGEPDRGPVVVILQLAASLQSVDQTRELLLLILFAVGVIAVTVSALVGWMTAGTALRPIGDITESALQITHADDLSMRIPFYGSRKDEVGNLTIAFNETLERLENLFETQRRFLADVSHELRTPLTAIRGNIDLIRRMGEADKISLDAITSEVDRMTRMVRDLLVLVQAETGKLPMAKEIVELDTLLLEVFQQAKVLAREKIEIRLGQEDQARVIGDRDRLKQVLLNLVANAIEHTPPGGDITMGLECAGEFTRLSVADTGKGIPPEDLPFIFERFYRAERSRKRTESVGAGLGLSIAYWITRIHDGRIEVESEKGKGTTFTVVLPLTEGSCEEFPTVG